MAEPQDWFSANAPKAATPPSGTWEDRGIAGKVWHPSTPPAAERVDGDVIGGVPLIGGIAPETVAAGAAGVARAMAGPAANAVGRVVAGAKALGEQVSPQIKYEVTKSTLTAMGVPPMMAMAAALAISGLKKGAPAEPTPEGPHLDRSVPMRPGEMTQQQIAERIKFGTGEPPQTRNLPKGPVGVTGPAGAPVTPVASAPAPPAPVVEPTAPASAPPPSAESTASRPANALPDQKALNEEALARRRAEYQARTAAPSKPANVKLNAAETSAYLNLMLKGKSSSEAMASVLQQRELIATLGTPTPTPEQTRFPKGMRGKVTSQ